MAKAKKKLNTKFLVTAATIAVSLGVAGMGGGYMVYRAKRPDQLKAEGRELMEQGKYEDAFKRFSRAGSRKATDPEFLTWMQETELHLTSFDPIHYRAAYGLHSAIINASSDKFPPTLKKLESDLIDIEIVPIDQMNQERARDLETTAKTVLEREPKNPKAYRARAYSKLIPLFQPGATPLASEVQSVVEALRELMQDLPTEPDLIYRYGQALAKHREAMIREMAISDSNVSQQAKELYKEFRQLSDNLGTLANNPASPAEEQARAHARNFDLLQVLLSLRLTPQEDFETFLVPRLIESANKASTLMPATNPQYLTLRLRHAGFLMTLKNEKNLKEAEKILRETVEALPKQWQPRLALANALSEQGRPLDAVKELSIDLQPSYELVGITGVLFNNDADAVPLRRAYFRLQSLVQLPPEKRDAEIALIEDDYKSAVSKPSLGGESNPYALQVKAGLQEIRQDRTGAVQTLSQALTKMSESPQYALLRIKVLEQLVILNLSLQQTGRAEEIAELLVRSKPGDFPTLLQLIDLKIRNKKLDDAKRMVEAARQQWPDQPALAALSIRLLPTEEAKRAELDKIPETAATAERTRDLVAIKMRLAREAGLESVANEIIDRYIKANPEDRRMALLSVESLMRQNKRDEARRRVASLRAKDPTDADLLLVEEYINAESPEKVAAIAEREAVKNSPANEKLIAAQKAINSGDREGYLRLMREAEALDPSGQVVNSLYIYFMSNGQLDEAEAELNKLAKLNRDPAEIRTNRLRINLARAAVLRAENRVAEANRLFDQASGEAERMIAEMPQFSGAWVVRGLAYQSRGQLNEALNAYDSALKAQPNNMEALRSGTQVAWAASRGDDMKRYIAAGEAVAPSDPFFDEMALNYEVAFGDPQNAIEPRKKNRDADPDKEATWLALGQTYMEAAKKAGDPAKASEFRKNAIDTFTQAKAKFPGSPGFGLAAASVMNDAGDAAGAQKLVDEMSSDDNLSASPSFLAALANYYLEQKQNDKAIEVMQRLAKSDKVNPAQIRPQLAQLYAQSGRIEEAMASVEGLEETPEIRELKVNLLLAARRTEEANKLANTYLEEEKTVTSLLLASHTEAQMRNIARSIELANEAVKLDGSNPNTHLYKAKAMMRQSPPRNAEIVETLDTVRKLSPSNAEARLLMADRLAMMGRNEEAVSELEAFIRDVPGNRDGSVKLIQLYLRQTPVPYNRIDTLFARLRSEKQMDAQLLSLETSIAVKRGDLQAAVRSAKEAAEGDPNNIGLYRQLLDVMIRAERYRDVLADLDRIQERNQNVYWTHMVRGIVLHRQKKDADAAKHWDRALSITQSLRDDSPTGEVVQKYAAEYGAEATGAWLKAKMGDDPRMRALMVNIYSSEKKFDQAIALGESLLPLPESLNKPTKIMILSSLGNAYLVSSPSRPDRARQVFEQLIQIDTDNALALNNLAYAILLEGTDLPAAIKHAQHAYDLTKASGAPNAYVVDTYGWALVRSGKVQEGIDVLREASTIEDIPDVAYHLGEAYLLENQKDAALQSLEKALVLLQNAIKNGESIDSGLETRIKDALARATAM